MPPKPRSTDGSSPRMRGTLDDPPHCSDHRRFIPAYAGNTVAHLPSSRHLTVHPRVCGEHDLFKLPERGIGGSSPRMRGTHSMGERRVCQMRFIPAYAGNTLHGRETSLSNAVHPRVCGEHAQKLLNIRSRYGSSPRMRGTHGRCLEIQGPFRFIPAYAGNTHSLRFQLL